MQLDNGTVGACSALCQCPTGDSFDEDNKYHKVLNVFSDIYRVMKAQSAAARRTVDSETRTVLLDSRNIINDALKLVTDVNDVCGKIAAGNISLDKEDSTIHSGCVIVSRGMQSLTVSCLKTIYNSHHQNGEYDVETELNEESTADAILHSTEDNIKKLDYFRDLYS